jgi:hypothetical protein
VTRKPNGYLWGLSTGFFFGFAIEAIFFGYLFSGIFTLLCAVLSLVADHQAGLRLRHFSD